MKIWYDACTGKHTRYGAAIGKELRKEGHEFIFTTREHPDTVPLARILGEKPIVVGKYDPSTLTSRLEESAERIIAFAKMFKDNKPDVAIAHQSVELCRTAFGLGTPIILTADTPHALAVNRLTIPFAHTVVVSEALPKSFTKTYCAQKVVPFKGVQVGRFEVTRAQFAQFDAGYPVPTGRENFPASGITFDQARKYCDWLSQLTGAKWRLPNAGEAQKLHEADETEENTLDHWAGYAPNPEDAAKLQASVATAGAGALLEPVGKFAGAGKEPVFDLGGNVAEWTTDKDGKPVLSGGSANQPKEARARQPQAGPDYTGFRVVKE